MANPMQKAATRRKIIYLGLILALFTVSILWRGKVSVPLADEKRTRLENLVRRQDPADREKFLARVLQGGEKEDFPDGPPAPASNSIAATADWLNSYAIKNRSSRYGLDLDELDSGDPEIAGTAARLSFIGLRGVVVTGLWWAAIQQQKRNEYQEFEIYVRAVTRMQPNFVTPWIYQSWNIAYNVSVENDRLNDAYFYIARGIELLAEGERLNKKSPDMRYQIAFYYQNKFGVSDKVATMRCLMQLSNIRPDDRDAKKRFRKPNGEIDLAQFQDFVRKNPQLVRRLREKLNCTRPEEVVQFLEDNNKVPMRFDRDTGLLAKSEDQFPTFPPTFAEGPDEFNAKSETDDTFDAFHAARAWYEYSLTVIPPPSGEPESGTVLEGEDRFKYRIPKLPTMIIFRQGAPRAQAYLAKRLSEEGWFDADTKWYPDERADSDSARWLPRPAGDFGAGEGVRAGSNSRAEWQRAYDRWKRHGELNGLQLDPAKLAAFAQGMQPGVDVATRMRNEQRLSIYEKNRQMTNFPFFLATAEADPRTASARSLILDAEQTVKAGDKSAAVAKYAIALAKWRGALVAFPQFHKLGSADKTMEDTYEYYRAMADTLSGSERVEKRVEAAMTAVQAVVPIVPEFTRGDITGDVAEQEAIYLISAFDDRVVRRAEDLKLIPANVKPYTLAYADLPAVRKLVSAEFAWLYEYKTESKDEPWVDAGVKQVVRERLGLNRPKPAEAVGGTAPPGAPGGPPK
jgi:hypothetical protein